VKNRNPAVNRSKAAFAALLLTIVAAVPAAAQQAPRVPQPATSEFCTGCFAYLEFPPLLEEAAPSGLASVQRETLLSTATGQESPIGSLKPSVASTARP
jgi:hypothetical protein